MASHTYTAGESSMVKAQGSYARLEILFWDLLFWAMKALQGLRDTWLRIANRISPALRYQIVMLLVVCASGLIFGFCLGFWKAIIGL
jgi:hypothetical protein